MQAWLEEKLNEEPLWMELEMEKKPTYTTMAPLSTSGTQTQSKNPGQDNQKLEPFFSIMSKAVAE